MSTYVSFDNTGMPYDPTTILTNSTFDQEKYHGYSPLYMPATLCMTYGVSFATSTAVFVHTFCMLHMSIYTCKMLKTYFAVWYRQDILCRFHKSLKDECDVHSRLMQPYAEVPAWWYGAVGIISFAFLIITIHIFPTQLPIWGACIAFFLSMILSVPLSMLQAITNQRVALQVMHELIAGYMLPGRPIANAIFKVIALTGTDQAVAFVGDLKLGHYMKIPPRTMFTIQVVAAVVSCIVVTFIQDWMFANVVDICTPNQKDGFTCPHTNLFATASLIWGGIGPVRIFSPGKMQVFSTILPTTTFSN